MFVIQVCVWVFPPYVRFVVCMRQVNSDFNSENDVSHASCALMLLLCVFYVSCILQVVRMWSVSCFLRCCVCLREEYCL